MQDLQNGPGVMRASALTGSFSAFPDKRRRIHSTMSVDAFLVRLIGQLGEQGQRFIEDGSARTNQARDFEEFERQAVLEALAVLPDIAEALQGVEESESRCFGQSREFTYFRHADSVAVRQSFQNHDGFAHGFDGDGLVLRACIGHRA